MHLVLTWRCFCILTFLLFYLNIYQTIYRSSVHVNENTLKMFSLKESFWSFWIFFGHFSPCIECLRDVPRPQVSGARCQAMHREAAEGCWPWHGSGHRAFRKSPDALVGCLVWPPVIIHDVSPSFPYNAMPQLPFSHHVSMFLNNFQCAWDHAGGK